MLKKVFPWCVAASLGFLATTGWPASPEVHIGRDGPAFWLDVLTGTNAEFVLETRADLATGEQWAPLLQLSGGDAPRRWYDPICGTPQTRFYRLQQKLSQPQPPVADFRLLDLNGDAHELYYQRDVQVVVLLLTGDDLTHVQRFNSTLTNLANRLSPDSARFQIIFAPPSLDRAQALTNASQLGLTFPILEDRTHAVTRTLGSGNVPEAVVVNTADWSVVYQGKIEDVVATGTQTVTQSYLADALDDFFLQQLAGVSMVTVCDQPAGLPSLKVPDYPADIAPLLINHCVRCHSPGNIAPWSMTNYDVVHTFAPLIKSAVLSGQMPPWHADPHIGQFTNDTRLAPEQVDLLVNWIDRGAQRGGGVDPLETNVPPTLVDWPLGTPDGLVSIAPQSIPATGTVDYRYLIAQSPFASDVWLKAAVLKPGNRAVVHHCLVFTGTLQDVLNLKGGLGGFFAGYVPGMEQVPFPSGTGKQLRKSDYIIFQMHYTTMGQAQTDQTQLGLYVAPQPPASELITGAASSTNILIQPNTRGYYQQATKVFPKDTILYEFSPHMHYRGFNARYTLVLPGGAREELLSVPSYFFNWQALYRLTEPKQVPAGTTLMVEGTFDNSIYNPFNPDPNQTVTFGEQTWDEMFIGYVNYVELP